MPTLAINPRVIRCLIARYGLDRCIGRRVSAASRNCAAVTGRVAQSAFDLGIEADRDEEFSRANQPHKATPRQVLQEITRHAEIVPVLDKAIRAAITAGVSLGTIQQYAEVVHDMATAQQELIPLRQVARPAK